MNEVDRYEVRNMIRRYAPSHFDIIMLFITLTAVVVAVVFVHTREARSLCEMIPECVVGVDVR